MHFSHSPTYGLRVRPKEVLNKAKGPTPSQDLQDEGLSSGKQYPLMVPRACATPIPDSRGLKILLVAPVIKPQGTMHGRHALSLPHKFNASDESATGPAFPWQLWPECENRRSAHCRQIGDRWRSFGTETGQPWDPIASKGSWWFPLGLFKGCQYVIGLLFWVPGI